MNEVAATERRLTVGEVAARLGVSYSTASRLLDGTAPALLVVRDRSWRMAYESQVSYVATALNACRPGSIADFAAEWLAQRKPKAEVTP